MKRKLRIALLGGGPSALFMFKRLAESDLANFEIVIFEKRDRLGAGLPYSTAGANDEHITNVSGNEIPVAATPISDWVKTVPTEILEHFHITEKFNDYKVLPRLLFGQYLTAQFELLLSAAQQNNIPVQVHFGSIVTDIMQKKQSFTIEINEQQKFKADIVVLCTGHYWPIQHEGDVPGYYDSPYPPSKLKKDFNHGIAIRGSSLTAVDAVRTLARHHGLFNYDDEKTTFATHPQFPDFRLILHTRQGLLPAVRFHLDNPRLENDRLLTREAITAHIKDNEGFLSLDYIFEKDFKNIFRTKEPEFYERIKDLTLEAFVADVMELREELDPFVLLKAEYAEAEKSIRRKSSVYWKEMLGVLSFALNYPAKHLSAEDMQRLQQVLLPLISIVIAYLPQSSAMELMALHQAGVLDIVAVGENSRVEAVPEGGIIYHYDDQAEPFRTFVDCIGQPHLDYQQFPFPGLKSSGAISPARLKYRSSVEAEKAKEQGQHVEQDANGDYFLHVSGITINDSFQALDAYGAYSDRLYIMAVPYIGGFNPDYSGLDFCEAASKAIIKKILAHGTA